MNRKIEKMLTVVFLLVVILLSSNVTYARYDDAFTEGKQTNNITGPSTEWWGQAHNFLNGASSSVGKEAIDALSPLVEMIKFVGNLIFVAVTIILGVKYIWGGVESKASVKDSLVTLIVAAVVFYGWSSISALFTNGNRLNFVTGDWKGTALTIYSTVLYIANFLAIGGIIYIGIKYLMAGAEGKSQLKAKGVPIVLGIVMVYATITFLNFILAGFNDVIAK